MKPKYRNIISFVWSKDIKRSLEFYTDALGCSVAYSSQNWIELSVPGLTTGYLALNLDSSDQPIKKNEFITLGVEDLQLFQEHLASHDVKVKGDIVEFYEEGIRMLKFFDPDGNVITAAETGF